jgi:uncharacterized protein (TIGR03083 family)
MKAPQPILVKELFPPTLDALIHLLNELSTDDWHKPTVCMDWSVKDVAQHLLAVEIGNVSRKRDKHEQQPEEPIQSNKDLLDFINRLNKSWMQATKRISPTLLVDLLEYVGKQANEFFFSINPFETGDPVSWVGPEPAPKWLDLAREYTERWHHQQHIRDSVGIPGMKSPRYFAPVLDTFIRALPYSYREITAPEGCNITLSILGDSGGVWTIQREKDKWILHEGRDESFDSEIIIAQEDAWRLFSKGINPDEVISRSTLKGDKAFGLKVFDLVSIIA